MKGRKRFALVDTQGWVLEVVVLPASMPERAGASTLFEQAWSQAQCAELELVWADGGFAGQAWEQQMREQFGWKMEIVSKPAEPKGFVVLPRRWVIERTFAWLGRHRRLSKDYEAHPQSSRAQILWAMIAKMLRRLHPQSHHPPFCYRAV